MQVGLKLMGMLKEKTPESGVLELPEGARIEDALIALAIPVDSVQVFTVNGSLVRDRGQALSDGDNLQVLPPVGGG